jgi:NAD-dependent deacetylase
MTNPSPRVLVVTGAGISAESGIPTFRGPGGYWRNLDPAKLATETAFRADPALVWEWYRERRELIRRSQPNAAHMAVVQLAAQTRDFLLLTQNVDDLHLRAAWRGRSLTQEQMVQIHGDIFVTKCLRCDYSRSESGEDAAGVPICPKCGEPLRPGVVWFDEELDPRKMRQVEDFLASGPCDLVLVVGTNATFDYIVNWALAAKGETGRLIEINPAKSELSDHATEVVSESATVALPRVVGQWLTSRPV